jgi:hypothetical protein
MTRDTFPKLRVTCWMTAVSVAVFVLEYVAIDWTLEAGASSWARFATAPPEGHPLVRAVRSNVALRLVLNRDVEAPHGSPSTGVSAVKGWLGSGHGPLSVPAEAAVITVLTVDPVAAPSPELVTLSVVLFPALVAVREVEPPPGTSVAGALYPATPDVAGLPSAPLVTVLPPSALRAPLVASSTEAWVAEPVTWLVCSLVTALRAPGRTRLALAKSAVMPVLGVGVIVIAPDPPTEDAIEIGWHAPA